MNVNPPDDRAYSGDAAPQFDGEPEDIPITDTSPGSVAERDPVADVPRYRGARSDPAFGFVIAVALAVGLSPLIGTGDAELRYTVSWGVLAFFGVLAWLFGDMERIAAEYPENIVWGIAFGLILGLPLLAFGGPTLTTAVDVLFGMMSVGTLLAYLVFVLPLAETLFFRGVLFEGRPFWMVGLLATVWAAVLFVPMMNLAEFPIVGLVILIVLVMMNMMYGYVRGRNGLAAAWVCQIVLNLVLVFVPSL